MANYSGLYGDGYTLLVNKQPGVRDVISKKLMRSLKLQELMLTLNGASAGSTAAKTYKRVAGTGENSGIIDMETVTVVNRVTTSADKADIDTILDASFGISTAPVNAADVPW